MSAIIHTDAYLFLQQPDQDYGTDSLTAYAELRYLQRKRHRQSTPIDPAAVYMSVAELADHTSIDPHTILDDIHSGVLHAALDTYIAAHGHVTYGWLIHPNDAKTYTAHRTALAAAKTESPLPAPH